METVDFVLHSASQLVTCASDGKPKRGDALRDVGIIENGALAVHRQKIVAVGNSEEIIRRYNGRTTINATHKVVCPGFVDCHTHAVFDGQRMDEFEQKMAGVPYLDILARGGGILSTVRATRDASIARLAQRLDRAIGIMHTLGTTSIEVKSGYGLTTASELALLRATEGKQVIPTFMGAHAIPPEYRGNADAYVDLLVQEMIPSVAEWYQTSAYEHSAPLFIDVFCEQNAFSVAQSQRILECGIHYGMRAKAHVDEFNALGGLEMALSLNAISVDHLDVTGADSIARLAQSDTVGVLMPAVNFHLGSTHYANARAMIDDGAIVALATDYNPGSAPCYSMPLVMQIGARYQHLLPSEALNMATINAAYAIGREKQVGSLEVGKQADLLILNVPQADYRYVVYEMGNNPVERVFVGGHDILKAK